MYVPHINVTTINVQYFEIKTRSKNSVLPCAETFYFVALRQEPMRTQPNYKSDCPFFAKISKNGTGWR